MSANFTPTLDGYTGQQPFRYWCQTVLPLVYDDSLSYYELLNKVVAYLNNVITDVSAVEGNVDALLNAYRQLQNYVNDYFENLDVQGEINNKLDEMATDGTLSQLISPYVSNLIGDVVAEQIGNTVAEQIGNVVAEQIDNVVAEQIGEPTATATTAWLNENVNPVGSAVMVDATLTISGAAADAKAVGDKSMLDRGVFTGTDLKTARQFGYYRILNADSSSISDLPVQTYAGKALTLEVHTGFAGGIIQKIYVNEDIAHAYYRYSPSVSIANPWQNYVVVIDSTLTQNNAAANAKTVGDKSALDRGNFSGTDLKTARQFGYYRILNNVSSNISDLPTQNYANRALTLEVHTGFGGGIIQKIYSTDDMTHAYYRYSANESAANAWQNVGNISMLDRGYFSGTDLKTARQFGYYRIQGNVSLNITDLPVQSYAGRTLTLEVHTGFGSGIVQKIYTVDDMAHAYYRHSTSESSATNWQNYVPENSIYSPLTNYKWCAIGDSFTHGDFTGVTPPTIETGKYTGQLAVYPYLIGNRTNMTIANIAVNGLRIGGDNGFVATQLSNIPDDSDYITIALGINDLPNHQNTPLGTINDATYDTFYGAWNVLMEYLFTNFGNKHIGIIVTNGVANQYKSYSDAIIDIAEKWCVPYLNMAYGIQVPTMNRSGKSQTEHPMLIFTARNSAFNVSSSNAHPNAKAHEYMSVFIENWLQTI